MQAQKTTDTVAAKVSGTEQQDSGAMKRIIKVFHAWLMCHPGPDIVLPKWWSKRGSQLVSLEDIRDYTKYADDLGLWTIEWYNCKNRRKKFWSFLWRAATIVSSTVGVLIPVMAPGPKYLKFGYFFALVAVFFLAIDRNFGFTSSWVRTVKASRAVETALTEFRTNTTKLAASNPAPLTRDWAQCVQDFLLKVRSLVDQEAETWSTETLANFNQLDRMVATGADEARKRYEQALDSLRAGGIELTIENPPQTPWTCSISVRGEIRKQNWSNPVCGLTEILPGPAEVRVDAKDTEGTTWEASRAVIIPSGAILPAISFKLSKLSQLA